MDEIEISGKRYISSRRAAKENRYHVDYIGQLIRGGKVLGTKVGRTWYVDEESLAGYLDKEYTKSEHEPTSVEKFEEQKIEQIEPEEDAFPIVISTEPEREEEIIESEQNSFENPEVHTGLVYVEDDRPLLPQTRGGLEHPQIKKNSQYIAETKYNVDVTDYSDHTSHNGRAWLKIASIVSIFGLITFSIAFSASYFLHYTALVEGGVQTASISIGNH